MSVGKKIFNEKLLFRENAIAKVKSLENIDHQPRSSDKPVYNEQLPWLRFNKPNLPERVKEMINRKQYFLDYSPTESDQEALSKERKRYIPILQNETPNSKVESKQPRIETTPNRNSPESKQPRNNVESNNSPKTKPNNTTTKDLKQTPPKKNPEKLSSPKPGVHSLKDSENSVKHLSNAASNKTLKIEKVQKHDASTETEFSNVLSSEGPPKNGGSSLKSKKLKNALTNSNRFESNYLIRANGDNGYGNSKLDRKENVITSRVIETFLPSISYSEKENKDKFPGSYLYYNSKRGYNVRTTNSVPTKHAVTHAGVSFLDQYWASQRWIMLNREADGSSRDQYESSELLESDAELPPVLAMKNTKNSQTKERHNFKDIYNDRIKHYSEFGENTARRHSPDIERITSKNLGKVIV